MTNPRNRQAAAGLQTAAAMAGAVDLSAVAAKAEASRNAPGGAPGAGTGASVVDVTEANFESDVIGPSANRLVLVELWSARSAEAVQFAPVMAELAQRAQGRWILARVDIDAAPGVAQAFGVQSVPMVVALASGQPVAAFNGPQQPAQIEGWIDEVLTKLGPAFAGGPAPSEAPEDPAMLAAEELMNSGEVDAALAAYRQIAESDPANTEASAMVRNLEFINRAQGHDPSIVDNAAPADLDAQFAAADVLLMSQQPEAAFERVLAVIRTTTGDDKERARTRLLELFELFDPAEPVVVAARRKLAAALY